MFNSQEFLTAWSEWKDHLKEKTLRAYTAVAERKALSALFKRCDGREQLAIDSIDYSIQKNWADIYIKPNTNGNGQSAGNNQSGGDKSGEQGSGKIQAYRSW